MPISKPQAVDRPSENSFRKAIRVVFACSMLGLQGDAATPHKDPYEGWDDLKYLYEDINAEPDPTPAPPAKEGDGSNGFDLLREPACDEDTCKLG